MQVTNLDKFLAGEHLEIRKMSTLNAIRSHCELSSKGLLAFLSNTPSLPIVMKSKILNYVKDIDEVLFVAENMHFFVCGMSKTKSTDAVLENKTVEIKNQGQWLTRHIPGMWDGSILITRFSSLVKNRLMFLDVAKLYYFETSVSAMSLLSAPFSYMKISDLFMAEDLAKVIVGATLNVAVTAHATGAVEIGHDEAKIYATIQAHAFDNIHLAVRGLIIEYEKAASIEAPMGETDECLRLIDHLESLIKGLSKDYAQARADYLKAPENETEIDKFIRKSTKTLDNMQKLLNSKIDRFRDK